MRAAICAALLTLAAPVAASDLVLDFPVDCTLGEDCHIQQFVDRDPQGGATDFTCGTLSYDGHKGTDIALPTLADLDRNVDVLAAAPGRVRGLRNTMPDTGYNDATASQIEGRECGNGVVLVHDGGWETQYCHLKQGSVTVAQGDEVAAGDVLGQIGLSGRTEFPHVHLSVRKDGVVVDPFSHNPDGDDQTAGCGVGGDSLWRSTPAYVAGNLIGIGFSDAVPDYADVKAGTASKTDLNTGSPALVVFGYAYGGQAGDTVEIALIGPQAEIVRQEMTLERNQAQFFRASGRRLRGDAWPAGTYEGIVTLKRGGAIIDTAQSTIDLR